MLLKNKTAIVYGAAGRLGASAAQVLAREGASVILVGRTKDRLQAVAADIRIAGGAASVAVVDATDDQAVNEHVRDVVTRAGHFDISINLLSHGDTAAGGYVQGVPMVELPAADFMRPIAKGVLSNYVTAQAAARQMVRQGSGVILTLTNATSTVGVPLMGSTGVAAAAIESFTRCLAAEVGQHGVRVCGVKIAAVVESLRAHDYHTDVVEGASGGLDGSGIEAVLANMSMLHRVTTMAQVTHMLAFLASDRANGMTGTIINLTGGMIQG